MAPRMLHNSPFWPSKSKKISGFLHIWLFDDAVKLKSPYLTQSVVFILPALTPYLQIGPVTCIRLQLNTQCKNALSVVSNCIAELAWITPYLRWGVIACMQLCLPAEMGLCVCANNSTQVDCSTKWLAHCIVLEILHRLVYSCNNPLSTR